MLSPFSEESINTMKAGWFELICANLFGKKTIGRDGCFTVTLSRWRGRSYLLDFRESK